jgi:hypothetical protein
MDDAAFLDDEIYDDDDLGHHAADDDDVAGILAPRAEDDATALGEAMDLFPASCFTPEYLSELAGTADLASCAFLEMRADTTDEDLSGVGRLMPALTQLRLGNSVVPSFRAFGSAFQRVTVLWISRSEVRDLTGVASLVDLRELYAAFNDVTDVAPLAELDHLTVVDLEGNRVDDPDGPDYLGMCPRLETLSLEGNPLSRRAYYRRLVCRAIPRLAVLDDRDVDPELDRMEIPEGLEDRMIGEEEAGEGGGEDDGTVGARATAGASATAAVFNSSAARGSGVAGVAALRKGGAASGVSLAATPLDTSVELALVTEGIKYAAVGIDDPDAVMVRDEVTGDLSIELAEDFLGPSLPGSLDVSLDRGARPGSSRPGSSRPGSSRPGSSRPGSGRPGSSRPGSSGGVRGGVVGGSSSRPPTAGGGALARSNSLGAVVRGAAGSRPGTALSGSSVPTLSRPGTAASSGSRGSGSSRPGTAASWASGRARPGAAASSRPGTASSRPGSRERPGTASSADGWGGAHGALGAFAGADTETLFWRKNKQKETRAGLAERGDSAEGAALRGAGTGPGADDAWDDAASALTTGEGMLVGNPAKLLSRRKREASAARGGPPGAGGGGGEAEDLAGEEADLAEEEDMLERLREWKIEMAETFSRAHQDETVAMEMEFEEEEEDEPPPAPPVRAPAPAPPKPKPDPPRFAPQPPKFAPRAPPGAANPRRPKGRLAAARAAPAIDTTGPETGVVLSRQNPAPRGRKPGVAGS